MLRGVIALFFLLGAFGAGYFFCQNDYLKAQNELKDQLREAQAELDDIAVDLAAAMGKTEIVFKEIEVEVIKYVETTPIVDCFDDNAVKLFNRTASSH